MDGEKETGGSTWALVLGIGLGVALAIALDNWAFLGVGIAFAVAFGWGSRNRVERSGVASRDSHDDRGE